MSASLFHDAARQALAEGVRVGAQRAGIEDPKTIASMQADMDEKYWADFKETNPSVAEARKLGEDFVKHAIDHLAGRNTAEKLAEFKRATWLNERARQRSNKATDVKFADADAWFKSEFPKLWAILVHGVGNRPAVARFILDHHTAHVDQVNRKQRSGKWLTKIRSDHAGTPSGSVASTALRSLSGKNSLSANSNAAAA
jgi:hypothetical protein